MPRIIESPTLIEAAGNKPKRIEEYAGRGVRYRTAAYGLRARSRCRPSPGTCRSPVARKCFRK